MWHSANKPAPIGPLSLVLVAIFLISGFSGLVYESIWSHYLKLFLGHAAYAQTLVLAIFMGGMALGAWVCSRLSTRLNDLLLVYAAIEGVIGVFSLLFHGIFLVVTQYAFEHLIPALEIPWMIEAVKWLMGAALIFPQSVLLGATFPAMVGGLLRLNPERSGYLVAILYCTNSIGAAIGALVTSFYLIGHAGLPGTLIVAGVINLAIAGTVILLRRWIAPSATGGSVIRDIKPLTATATGNTRGTLALFLLVAALTGATSFMYEISWIRMLSLVLSSSTHAFELMLSAFILGIALGGFWIRRHLDNTKNTARLLGIVQIAMGLAALLTLPVYNASFYIMQWFLRIIQRTEDGYLIFNVASHAIALAVMFPAAFCAGMTLPLITKTLLAKGEGEAAIGRVYSANTAGAIIGIFFAVHLGMPFFGLKGLIIIGALIDVALGIWLLRVFTQRRSLIIALASGALVLVIIAIVPLNTLNMSSGVYRFNGLAKKESTSLLSYKDGKTATITVQRDYDSLSIATNGKVDASVSTNAEQGKSLDELTMLMTGALPQFFLPNMERAAVIGFGSGITTHTLLASPNIRQVDTIEIEPEMFRGAARYFKDYNKRALEDPRSKIHFDDAKTYFSSHPEKYDVIISEPSNPWVSGVSSLFTLEFYQYVRRYLKEDGILVQWLQGYEMSPVLFSSVIKALDDNFSDYQLWRTNTADFLLVASNQPLPSLTPRPFRNEMLRTELESYGLLTLSDMEGLRIGDKQILKPYFDGFGASANSDFFPILDIRAPLARFTGKRVDEFTNPRFVSILEFFKRSFGRLDHADETSADPRDIASRAARYMQTGDAILLSGFPSQRVNSLFLLNRSLVTCHDKDQKPPAMHTELIDFIHLLNSGLSRGTRKLFWNSLENNACIKTLSDAERHWLELGRFLSNTRPKELAESARAILEKEPELNPNLLGEVVILYMAGAILSHDPQSALAVYQQYRSQIRFFARKNAPLLNFLVQHAKNSN